MSNEDRLRALEKELAELRAKLAELRPKAAEPFDAGPWRGPIDYTAGATMDSATMLEFGAAAGSVVVNDARRSITPSSIIPKPEVKEEPKVVPSEKGWITPAPLEPYEGQKHIDRMMDQEDALWRGDLAQRLGQVQRKEDK